MKKNIVARNKQAKYNYTIEQIYESGICLFGSEIKSIRQGKINITDAFASFNDQGLFIYNIHIAEYKEAHNQNHDPLRPRRLLLHKREMNKLFGKIKLKGYSLIAVSAYLDHNNRLKIELGVGKGKKLYDKREAEKAKDWNRKKNIEFK